jgi:hypothetical protein
MFVVMTAAASGVEAWHNFLESYIFAWITFIEVAVEIDDIGK